MHLALPSRKRSKSNPPSYGAQASRFPTLRRSRVQQGLIGVCALGVVLYIISRIFGGSDRIPSGTPPVVIVTVLDPEGYSKDYIQEIKENRIAYAKRHGK